MKKEVIKEQIFGRIYEGLSYEVKFEDLPKNLKDNDVIEIWRDKGSSDGSFDECTILDVYRYRIETDEEYNDRLKREEIFQLHMKEKRKEQYLKLKKEFENEEVFNGYTDANEYNQLQSK